MAGVVLDRGNNGGGTYQGYDGGGNQSMRDLYQQIVLSNRGNNTISPLSSYNQGPTWQERQRQYQESGGGYHQQSRQQQQDQQRWSNRMRYNTDQQREEGATYHEATPLESLGAWAQDTTAGVMEGLTGFNRNRQTYGALDPRTIGSFLFSLPFQPLTAIGEGIAGGVELINGSNVTQHYKDENGVYQIKDERLTPIQLGAQAANTAINLGGNLLGGTGDAVVALGSKIGQSLGKSGKAFTGYADDLIDTAEAAAKEAYRKGEQTALKAGKNATEAATAGKEAARNQQEFATNTDWKDILPGGVFNRRTGGKAKAEGRQVGIGKIMASDAVEEGLEEFAQTYLEGARYDNIDGGTFGQALEAAAWGAAGGAAMGGAAAGIQSTIETARRHGQDTKELEDAKPPRMSLGESSYQNVASDEFSQAYVEELQERAQKGNEQPGMISAKSQTATRAARTAHREDGTAYQIDPSPNTMAMSWATISKAYNSDPGARQKMEESFGIDHETAVRLFSPNLGREQRAQAIFELRQIIHDRPVYVAYGRNPRTSEFGTVLLKLDDIFDGEGVFVDSLVHENFCDDLDGDMAMIAFAGEMFDSAKANGTATRQLALRMNAQGDDIRSNVKYEFANFLPTSKEDANPRSRMAEIFDNLRRSLRLTRGQCERLYKMYSDSRTKHANGDNKGAANDMTKMMVTLNQMADESGTREGSRAINNDEKDLYIGAFYQSLLRPASVETMVSIFGEAINEDGKYAGKVVEQSLKKGEENPASPKGLAKYGKSEDLSNQRGKYPGKRGTDWIEYMGLSSNSSNASAKNPVFRQSQYPYFVAHGIPQNVLNKIYDPSNDLEQQIAAVLNLRACGLEPETVVNDALNSWVYYNARQEYSEAVGNVDGLVTNGKDWDTFIGIWVKWKNKGVDVFAECMKKTLVDGEASDFLKALPQKIEDGPSGKPLPREAARAFFEAFSNSMVDSVWRLPDGSPFAGFTFYDMISYMDVHQTEALTFDTVGLYEPIKDMLANFEQRTHAANKTFKLEAQEVFDKAIAPMNLGNHVRRNGDRTEIDEGWEQAATAVFDWINFIMPRSVLKNVDMVGMKNAFFNSEIGYAILTSKSVSDLYNNIFRLSLFGEYYDALWFADLIDNGEDVEQNARNIMQILGSKKDNSLLHTLIHAQAQRQMDRGNYRGLVSFLDNLMDPSRTWEEKVELIDNLSEYNIYHENEEEPILIYALAGSDSQADLVDFTARRQRAVSTFKNNQAFIMDYAKRQVQNFKSVVESHKYAEDDIMLVLQHLGRFESNTMLKGNIVAFLRENFEFAKDFASKGTDTDIQTFLYESLQKQLYGDSCSFLNGLTHDLTGSTSYSQFIQNPRLISYLLFNPDKTILVRDDVYGDQAVEVSQRKIFDAFGIEFKGQPRLSHYIALFESCPQLFTALAPKGLSAVDMGSGVSFSEKQVKPTMTAITELLEGMKAGTVDLGRELHYNATENYLMQQSGFYSMVIHCIKNYENLDEDQFVKELEKSWTNLVDFFYEWSDTDEDSEQNREIDAALWRESALGLSRDLLDLTEKQQHMVNLVINGEFDCMPTREIMRIQLNRLNDLMLVNEFNQRFIAPGEEPLNQQTAGIDIDGMRRSLQRAIVSQEQCRLVYMAMSIDPRTLEQYSVNVNPGTIAAMRNRIRQIQDDATRNAATAWLDNLNTRGAGILNAIAGSWGGGSVTYDMHAYRSALTDEGRAVGIDIGREAGLVSPIILLNVEERLGHIATMQQARPLINEINEAITGIMRYCTEATSEQVLQESLSDDFRDYRNVVEKMVERIVTAQNANTRRSETENLRNYLTAVNMQLVDFSLRKSKSGTQAKVNEGGGTQMLDTMNQMRDMVGDIRKLRNQLADSTGHHGYKKNTEAVARRHIKFPEFNFTNSTVSFAAQQAITNASSAGAAAVVSRNGQMTKTLGILGLISPHHSCPAQPTPMTWQDLQTAIDEDPAAYYNVVYYVNTTDASQIKDENRRRVSGAARTEQLAPDTPVVVYVRPCTSSACENHTPVPRGEMAGEENDNVCLFARILERGLKWSKEGLALTYKKNLEAAARVVDRIEEDETLNPNARLRRGANNPNLATVDVANFLDAEEGVVARAQALLKDYQDRYGKAIHDQFTQRSYQDISELEARAVAQGLCHTVRISFADGSTMVVSSDWLLSDTNGCIELIAQQAAATNSKQIMIKPNPMDVDTIANHLIRAVARWKFDHQDREDPISEEELRRVVTDAYYDWSEYRINDDNALSVRTLFSKIGAMSTGVSTALPLATSRTAMQRFDNQAHPEMNQTIVTRKMQSKFMPDDRFKMIKRVNRNYVRRMNVATGDFVRLNTADRPNYITAVFRDPNTTSYDAMDNRWLSGVQEIAADTQSDGQNDDWGQGLVLVADKASMTRALNYARKFQKNMLVPASLIREFENLAQNSSLRGDTYRVTGTNENNFADCYFIDMQKEFNDRTNSDIYATFEVQDILPESILYGVADTDPDNRLLHGADTDFIFNPKTTDWWGINTYDSYHVPARNLFSDNYGARISQITKSDLDAIVNQAEDGNIDLDYWCGTGKMFENRAVARERIASYLRQAKNDTVGRFTARGMWKQRDVNQNECIGFVKKRDSGGKMIYAPVFVSKSTPRRVRQFDEVGLDETGEIRWRYAQTEHMSVGDSRKFFLPGQASKFLGTVAEANYPKISAKYQQRGYPSVEVGYMRDGLSDKNRDFGRGELIIASNFAYEMAKYGGSIFYHIEERNGKTVVRWNQSVRATLINQSREDAFQKLIDGDSETWRSVANGSLRLASGNDIELNQIYRDLANRCILADIDPRIIFHTIDVKGDGSFYARLKKTNFRALFQGMTMNQILRFYHHMDLNCRSNSYDYSKQNVANYSYYCPDGINDTKWIAERCTETATNWRYNNQGAACFQDREGNPIWLRVEVAPLLLGDETTAIGSMKDMGNYGWEQRIVDLLDQGRLPKDDKIYRGLLEQFMQQAGFSGVWSTRTSPKVKRAIRESPYSNTVLDYALRVFDKDGMAVLNQEYEKECVKYGKQTIEYPMQIAGVNGTELTRPERDRLNTAVAEFNKHLQMSTPLSARHLMLLYQNYIGYSRTIAQTANETVPLETFCEGLETIQKCFDDNGVFIMPGMIERSEKQGDERVSLPLIDHDLATMLWNRSALLRSKWGETNQQDFFDAMLTYQHQADVVIESDIQDVAKQRALMRQSDFFRIAYKERISNDHIFRDTNICQRAKKMAVLQRYASADPEIVDTFVDAINEAEERVKRHQHNFEMLQKSYGNTVVEGTGTRSGTWSTRTTNTFTNLAIWKRGAQLSQTLGLMDPFIPVGNCIGRMLCGGITNFTLRFNQHGIGKFLYEPGIVLDPDFVKALSHDPDVIGWFKALKVSTYEGMSEEFMQCRSAEDFKAYIAKERGSASALGKALDKVSTKTYQFASMGEAGISRQIELFINRMAQLLGSDQGAVGRLYSQTVTDDQGNEVTQLQAMLEQNSIDTLREMFTGIAFHEANVAWNDSLRGDMAQRNVVTAVFYHLANRNGLVKFLTTTCVSKYFNFATNLTGRVLSMVAPMSSLHYLVTNVLSQQKSLEYLNLQDVQTHRSLKEAIHADMIHMGAFALGEVIAVMAMSVSGLLEPPDDEKKMVNPFEWRFFGYRVDTVWWLEDILGIALPYACTLYEVMNGQGRYAAQTLVNGITQATYNNPIFSITDLVDGFLDDVDMLAQGGIVTEGYEESPGGDPSSLELVSNNAIAGTLNWFSQFITPGFVKEIANARQLEVSYKKRQAVDEYGNKLYDDRGLPLYEDVDYLDAQIRKITRNNPWLGFICDVVSELGGGEGGYMPDEMPNVIYPEPVELFSANAYALTNEDGTEKTDAEKQGIALEIITTLQCADDMKELRESGFYIPYETKIYVGQVIWDTIYALDQNMQAARINGDLDYYKYGDYSTGERIVGEIWQAYKDEVQAWYDLSDKLWSEDMRKPLVVYNGFNTTYAQDADGNWYRTGMPKSTPISLQPFNIAPYDDNSLGPEQDWATPSALGENISTGMRALIPYEADLEEYHSPEDFSGDGNGNGYSGANTGVDGALTDYDISELISNLGGGYGGGGGGGGGRSIHSTSPNISAGYPTTMNTGRYYGPNYDYLRPGFETKGSREASKRQDF